MSLREISNLTGVGYSTIGKIERGESDPQHKTMIKIAGGLNMKFEDVFITDYDEYERIIAELE